MSTGRDPPPIGTALFSGKVLYLEQMAQAPFIPRGVSLAHSHGAYSSPHQEWKQALGSREDVGTVTVP